jgi:hypothetical protein
LTTVRDIVKAVSNDLAFKRKIVARQFHRTSAPDGAVVPTWLASHHIHPLARVSHGAVWELWQTSVQAMSLRWASRIDQLVEIPMKTTLDEFFPELGCVPSVRGSADTQTSSPSMDISATKLEWLRLIP